MFTLNYTNKFLKDAKLLKKRSVLDAELLKDLLVILEEKGVKGLDKKHKPHKLAGDYKGLWECHVKPDLLLIWDENEVISLIQLIRTGTHSDLF